MIQPCDLELLEDQIINKRREMYSIALSLGFTHPRVVACSQDLDSLMNQFLTIELAS